jgi:TfoX/Sxy family transcriptional regulator of competence genes
MIGGVAVASNDDLAERVRAALAGTGGVGEVRMFGGLCFTLNGNMVAGASKRGLLVRVGKERHDEALARPGVRPMEMKGQPVEGYLYVDPPPRDARALRDWLDLAVGFVGTLPPKLPKSTPRRTRNG